MIAWVIIRTLAQRESTGTVCRGEGGTGIEGDEEIVDESGTPGVLSHIAPCIWSERHLGKEKGPVGMRSAQVARIGATAIQSPVPGGEDENVGQPERRGGA